MSESNQERLAQVLSEFAAQIGLDGLVAEESGYCCLELENGRVIHLQLEDDDLLLVTELGTVPAGEDRLPLLEELLTANAFWKATRGATIFFEPTESTALLARRLPLGLLVDCGLAQQMEQFIITAEQWSERLNAPTPAPTDLVADNPPLNQLA